MLFSAKSLSAVCLLFTYSQLWSTLLNHNGTPGLCKLHFSLASLLPVGFYHWDPWGAFGR